ncbi:MAG: DUF2459 domain-containing protein [Planctomycetes bacterium]|nr:DUF2459 domain-containing protein [Planctomycetota bacterium]
MTSDPTRRRSRLRRFLRFAATTAVAISFLVWAIGCTSTIRPPAQVDDPVDIFLLLDARHRGLILPHPDDGLVEYGYGEWWWYALGDDAWYDAFRAVLWPTQGTLGRRRTGATDLESLRDRFHWMTIQSLVVERERVNSLVEDLETARAERREDEIWSDRYGFWFVPFRTDYWAFHNCNDEVADWLERLGCDVSWVPICLDLEFAAPE